ncbi:hypothetical protein UFOVP112_374 [uncultured Caudovirales phage]|uniref:Uncharacterized protein n=1 Tax=uncultured Caudovirales phage TaxID=2100421 RepID=A0A6J5L7S5_9CAUD|nr:hypothetical protein UFOVP112_374 [uncultured Caudovirales phage]
MAYDHRAVKVSKSVKRVAATITDKARRRDFIRGYALAEAANARQSLSRKRGDKSE